MIINYALQHAAQSTVVRRCDNCAHTALGPAIADVSTTMLDRDALRRLSQLADWFRVSKYFGAVCRDIAARLFIANATSKMSIYANRPAPSLVDLYSFAYDHADNKTLVEVATQMPRWIESFLGRPPKQITQAKSPQARITAEKAAMIGYENEANLARSFYYYTLKQFAYHDMTARLWSLLGLTRVFANIEDGESDYAFPSVLLAMNQERAYSRTESKLSEWECRQKLLNIIRGKIDSSEATLTAYQHCVDQGLALKDIATFEMYAVPFETMVLDRWNSVLKLLDRFCTDASKSVLILPPIITRSERQKIKEFANANGLFTRKFGSMKMTTHDHLRRLICDRDWICFHFSNPERVDRNQDEEFGPGGRIFAVAKTPAICAQPPSKKNNGTRRQVYQ